MSVKEVFVIVGEPNSGKSTFINSVVDVLLTTHEYAYDFKNFIQSKAGKKLNQNLAVRDKFGILKSSPEKKTIGVLGCGDGWCDVKACLKKFDSVDVDIDILICAASTGTTPDVLAEIKKKYSAQQIQVTPIPERRSVDSFIQQIKI